jgi:hypothetical protein
MQSTQPQLLQTELDKTMRENDKTYLWTSLDGK